MSAVRKFIDYLSTPNPDKYQEWGMVELAIEAKEDLQRLVSWVESAEHARDCDCPNSPCTCGLDEIQSLLRS